MSTDSWSASGAKRLSGVLLSTHSRLSSMRCGVAEYSPRVPGRNITSEEITPLGRLFLRAGLIVAVRTQLRLPPVRDRVVRKSSLRRLKTLVDFEAQCCSELAVALLVQVQWDLDHDYFAIPESTRSPLYGSIPYSIFEPGGLGPKCSIPNQEGRAYVRVIDAERL
jgi:hypothetical protein